MGGRAALRDRDAARRRERASARRALQEASSPSAPSSDAAPVGLAARLAAAWTSARPVFRAEAAQAGPLRLCGYAAAAALLVAAGVIAAHLIAPQPAMADAPGAWATAQLKAAGVRMAAFVALGLALWPLCWVFGGTGGWRETLAAVVWSALVAAVPTALIALAGGLGDAAGAPGWWFSLAVLIGPAVWMLALAPALAEAHGFTSSGPILGVMSLALVVVVAAVLGA